MQTLEAKSTNGIMPEIWAKAKELPLQASIARVVIGAGYKVECEIVDVTPEMAKAFLGRMVKNRPLRWAHIKKLSIDRSAGHWCFTGQPLIFDPDNFLLDGQHRCHMIVKTGLATPCLIVRGVHQSAFDRIDAGAKRTGGDVLSILGTAQANATASVIAHLIGYRDNGSWWHPANSAHSSAHAIATAAPLFPGLADSVRLGRAAARELGQRPALWSTAHYLMTQKDAATCTVFYQRIISGLGLGPKDPEYQLRKRMLEFLKGSVILKNEQFAAMVANAWNNRRRNKQVSHIKGLVEDGQVSPMI